jgi:two-component system, chemotaxis family, chemotaxis protein CheY
VSLAAAQRERLDPTGGRARVVLADESGVMRTLLRTVLERRGLETVGEARDGVGALTLALGLRADVVLLETGLRSLDAFTAAELIGWQEPETIIVLYTADPTETARRRARVVGLPLVDRLDLPDAIRQIAESRLPLLHPAGDRGSTGASVSSLEPR